MSEERKAILRESGRCLSALEGAMSVIIAGHPQSGIAVRANITPAFVTSQA